MCEPTGSIEQGGEGWDGRINLGTACRVRPRKLILVGDASVTLLRALSALTNKGVHTIAALPLPGDAIRVLRRRVSVKTEMTSF